MTYAPHPLRIQRRRAKGYKMPPGAVYCGRPTIWGNPFDTAAEFRQWMKHMVPEGCTLADFVRLSDSRDVIFSRISELRGKQLACWCPLDKPCHVDVLCELANREPNQ